MIPESFKLKIGEKLYWVHANATKHMFEYFSKKVGSPISEQVLLSSFKEAVAKAYEIGYTYEVAIRVGAWELTFSPARAEGLLEVIKHAVYKP